MSLDLIKQLREKTGAGMMDVKKALDEAGGDADKAIELIRKRGEAIALKKADRAASEGAIISYIHMDKIGVLVELRCETDFVARTDDFKALGKDFAMQVASMGALYLNAEDVPADVVEKEREIYAEQVQKEGEKPADVMEKILDGKVKKYFSEVCLMEQKFFKDGDKTMQDVLTEGIAKMGENIQVSNFVRFTLGSEPAGSACSH